MIWKLRDSPSRLISYGLRFVMSVSVRGGSSRGGTPKRPLIRLKSVDLPAPLGPMIAWRSPAGTARSTPRMISVGRTLGTPSSSSASHGPGGVVGGGGGRARAHVGLSRIQSSISTWTASHCALKAAPVVLERAPARQEHRARRAPRCWRAWCRTGSRRAARDRPCPTFKRHVVISSISITAPNARHQRRQDHAEVGVAQAAELPELHHAQVHQDQARQPARREHHEQDEEHAEVELPRLRELRQGDGEDHEHDRAQDRAEEERRLRR